MCDERTPWCTEDGHLYLNELDSVSFILVPFPRSLPVLCIPQFPPFPDLECRCSECKTPTDRTYVLPPCSTVHRSVCGRFPYFVPRLCPLLFAQPLPLQSDLLVLYPVAGTFCVQKKCQMITVAHSELTRLGQSDCLCLPLF